MTVEERGAKTGCKHTRRTSTPYCLQPRVLRAPRRSGARSRLAHLSSTLLLRCKSATTREQETISATIRPCCVPSHFPDQPESENQGCRATATYSGSNRCASKVGFRRTRSWQAKRTVSLTQPTSTTRPVRTFCGRAFE